MQEYISMYSAFLHHDWYGLIDAVLNWIPKQVFFSSLIDAVIHKETTNKWMALAIKANSIFALNLWQAQNKAPVVHKDEAGLVPEPPKDNYNIIKPGEVESVLPNAH